MLIKYYNLSPSGIIWTIFTCLYFDDKVHSTVFWCLWYRMFVSNNSVHQIQALLRRYADRNSCASSMLGRMIRLLLFLSLLFQKVGCLRFGICLFRVQERCLSFLRLTNVEDIRCRLWKGDQELYCYCNSEILLHYFVYGHFDINKIFLNFIFL